MQSQTVLVFGVLLCVVCSITSVAAGHGKGNFNKTAMMEKMKKCGDGEIDLKEAFKGKEECMPQKTTEEESRRRRSPDEGQGKKGGKGKWRHMKKDMCVAVCMWKKQGILDDSGKYSESGAQEYVNKVYPDAVRANVTTAMKECADKNAASFSMDDKCAGYKKFKRCTMKSHFTACGIKGGWGGWGKGGKGKKPDQGAPPSADEEAGDEE